VRPAVLMAGADAGWRYGAVAQRRIAAAPIGSKRITVGEPGGPDPGQRGRGRRV